MVFGSLFERIRTGLRVAKASFGVLRREYWLLVFPVLYGIAWLAGVIGLLAGILVALVGAGYGLAAVDQVATVSEGQAETAVTALLVGISVLIMFVATAVATFFSAALVHSVGSLFALDAPWAVLQYTLAPTLLALGALLVVHNTATAVAKTALYEYATGGKLPPEFDGIDPDQLVTRKRSASSMTGSTGREPGRI